MPGRRTSGKRARHIALLEAAAEGAGRHGHDDCEGAEPTSTRARLAHADGQFGARARTVLPDDACKDCAQPRLPGRADASGAPLRSLCAWCYACRSFDSGAHAHGTFAATQTDIFRDLSKNTMSRILSAPATEQYQFWIDQIRSKRSYPLCTFRDRASDSLMCSLLAWDPDRATGLRFASDTRPPFDARAPALFDVRAQALEDYIVENEEEEGWDHEDKECFRVENLFPVDEGFLARRAAENQRMMSAVAAELAERAGCGQGSQSVDGTGGRPSGEGQEGAHAAGEDAPLYGYQINCAATQREQLLRLQDADDDDDDDQVMDVIDEDDDDQEMDMIDEDYAAEHNYRVY